jgi:mercuric transport protein
VIENDGEDDDAHPCRNECRYDCSRQRIASAAERTVTLAVENMYCDACPYIVKQSLAKVPGVDNVIVSFEQKTATGTYDDQKTAPDALTP